VSAQSPNDAVPEYVIVSAIAAVDALHALAFVVSAATRINTILAGRRLLLVCRALASGHPRCRRGRA